MNYWLIIKTIKTGIGIATSLRRDRNDSLRMGIALPLGRDRNDTKRYFSGEDMECSDPAAKRGGVTACTDTVGALQMYTFNDP